MRYKRRKFLGHAAGSLAAVAGWKLGVGAEDRAKAGPYWVAPFRLDVTPPLGHSCCGGWIQPVVAVDDPLQAMGFVLLGLGKPIVVVSVDWTGLLNSAHQAWRVALAEAAGTTADRVTVHCVHQHNAPMACLDAERLVAEHSELPAIVDVDFFHRCLDRAQKAVSAALKQPHQITHIAWGQATVEKVASNRRVHRDAAGHVLAMRGSSCADPHLRALPEGLIDPWLKTVSFYGGKRRIVACHYYATHPMSYYGDGRVTSDFVGLARRQRQHDEPDCQHIYFTGCAGNIAAGKYNDGSKPVREILTTRVYQAMVQSDHDRAESACEPAAWYTVPLIPEPRKDLAVEELSRVIADRKRPVVDRNRSAYMLAWLERLKRGTPILLSTLHMGPVRLLHVPAECFVQYQLRAQAMDANAFVAVAAYGDSGPWYIPTAEEYPCGGYEVSVAFCDPGIDALLDQSLETLLAGQEAAGTPGGHR